MKAHSRGTHGPETKLARHGGFAETRAYIEVAGDMMRAAAEKATDRPVLGVVNGGKR